GQGRQASGLNNAHHNTKRWLASIQPHLKHLAAASSASTSLEANLKHITVTLGTWGAVWEVNLDPNTPSPAKRSKRTKTEQAAEPTQHIKSKGKGKGKGKAKAVEAKQQGRWLDRD
ncbi:hypothetical protein QJQ45_016322, partial [Haematococcus lacustris]